MKRAAFVTGGASGIGLSVCEHLARTGCRVVMISSSSAQRGASRMTQYAVPVGRVGTGDDIAAACMCLVSEEASYVTGQTVSVNGGSFAGW